MDRSGNSILAGTLLASLLLSPGLRSNSPDPTPQPEQATEKEQAHRLLLSAAGSQLSVGDRKRIRKEAQTVYLREFEDVISDECEKGDLDASPQEPAPAAASKPVAADSSERVGIGQGLTKKAPKAGRHSALGIASSSCQLGLSNFIIALLPDPVHTHLALGFDRAIDAIEEGAQDEGYLFVHSMMPWDSKTHPESEDHVEREATEVAQEAREEQPGLLLFRAQKAAGKSPPLIVFVVGEAPTSGINKDQFRHAVLEMEKLMGIDPKSEGKITEEQRRKLWNVSPTSLGPGLRILGPTSSGSLKSLLDLMACKDAALPEDKPQPCYPLVSIHSGTVSSYDVITDFDERASSLHAHFVSFQESDDVMIERFQEFITGGSRKDGNYGNRYYEKSKIALLSEDESAYGNVPGLNKQTGGRPAPLTPEKFGEPYGNIADWWPDVVSKRLQWLKRIGGDRERRAYPPDTGKKEPDSMLTLYFPREISQLRAVYQKDVASTTADGRNVPRDILPNYADVPGSDDDTVAPYSARQMPLSQESVMLGIVSELKKNNIQFILLRASDPIDTLFLIRYLRGAYPQGRIVTIRADMLFRREAEDPHFHGLLSLSTYSVSTTANEGFSDYERQHAERVFPSTSEAGTYNAVRSLLIAWDISENCRGTLQSHMDQARHPLSLYQYGWRQQPMFGKFADYDAPPVRLLALGRDQYWPIASLGPFEGENKATLLPRASDQLVEPPRPIAIPNAWRLVQLIGLALALFFCVSLLNSSIFSTLQPFARFAPALRDRRLTLILVAGGMLIAILQILMWPALHGAKSTSWPLEPALLFATGGVFVTTLLEGFDRVSAVRKLRPRPKTVEKEKSAEQKRMLNFAWVPQVKIAVAAKAASAAGTMNGFLHRSLSAPMLSPGDIESYPEPNAAPGNYSSDGERWPVKDHELHASKGIRPESIVRPRPTLGKRVREMRPVILFVFGCLFVFLGAGVGEPYGENSALVRWYTILRTVQLTSGLSFIMPTFFLLTVWLWWAEHLSSGYALLDGRRPRLPKGMLQQRVKALLPKQLPELYAKIKPVPYSWLYYFGISAVVILISACLMGLHHPVMSLEKPFLEWLMTILLMLAVCGIVATTVHAWDIWVGLRRLLVQLDMVPLRDAFKSVEGFSWKPIWRFGAGSLTEFLRIFARQRAALDIAIRTRPELADPTLNDQMALVQRQVEFAKKITHKKIALWNLTKRFHWKWRLRREAERAVLLLFSEYQKKSAVVAGRALDFLAERWGEQKEQKKHSRVNGLIPYLEKRNHAGNIQVRKDEQLCLEMQACERFVCMSYVAFILTTLVRLRTLILAIGGMYVLTLVAISQYPFEPKGALQLLLVVLLAFVVAMVGLVFAQVHRDTVLSNLTDTNPGELGMDFFVRMASFVALPLFSLLASQFPSVNRFFYSWLQPAVEALNH